MSFFTELRRRNVFRAGLAYLAGVWLILQVASVILPNFGAPAWIMQVLVVSSIIGFVVTLVVAWFYELTPEGIRASEDVEPFEAVNFLGRKIDFAIIGLLVVALGFLVVDNYILGRSDDSAFDMAGDRSIAVLPFVNISAAPEDEYFADGLTEEILNLLAKIPTLKVIGRTSSFAFKGKNEDLRAIGQALGVATILEGSVRRSVDQVRITAQLINSRDGAHIWSETYDRTMTEIFAIQDDVALAIIGALRILDPDNENPQRGRPTDDPEAYAQFLKARVLLSSFESLEAEMVVRVAIERDPNFAEAHELLASVYWSQAGGILAAPVAQARMGEAAANALAIDPELVLARALERSGNLADFTLLGELEALEQAVRDQPDNPLILAALVFNLEKAGYLQEALTVARKLVEVDPLSQLANGRWRSNLFAVGRVEEAFANHARAEIDLWDAGEDELVYRRDGAAVEHFELALEAAGHPDSPWVQELVAGARDLDNGQAYLDQRIPQIIASVPAAYSVDLERQLLNWYLYFGFLDRYFDIIFDYELTDKSWTDADDLMVAGITYRSLGFTAHPRFVEAAELLGITDVWEQRGPPDFCRQEASAWVCE